VEIKLNTGHTHLQFKLGENCDVLAHGEIKKKLDRNQSIKRLTKLINRLVTPGQGNTSIAMVVADKTRFSELTKFMPWIEEAIEASEIQHFTITFFIAYGSHPKQSDAESRAAYGAYYSSYKFIHHDARKAGFQDFGRTKSGTPVLINENLFGDHDLVITYGSISHHYFAGFGGGRKLLFPGLASYSGILHNHSLFLDFATKSLEENCQSGVLDGNPLAMDLKEIYEKLPPTLGIHTILNPLGEVCEIEAGLDYATFEKACKTYSKYYKIAPQKKYDLMLTSAGAYPKDINFIQAHKSIHSASSFVKKGGTLLILAECADGIGNRKLLEMFRRNDWNKIFPETREEYENNTGTVLAQLEKSSRIQICMITSLNKETCDTLGVKKTDHREAQELITAHKGSMGIIEHAGIIY